MVEERDPTPLYMQVKKDIEQKEWLAGNKIPSLRSLSREFNVSVETVRQAVLELVGEGKFYRRWGKGIFVPSENKVVEKGKPLPSRTIGVVLPQLPLFRQVHDGICQVAQEKEYDVIFAYRYYNADDHTHSWEMLKSANVKNMILVFPNKVGDIKVFVKRHQAENNFVLLDGPVKGIGLDNVGADHFRGAYEAVHYLLRMGHKRIGYLTHTIPNDFRDRQRGEAYCRALENFGLEVDSSLILRVHLFRENDKDRGKMRKYLSSPGRPTALFAFCDDLCVRAFKTIRSIGLKVPQDIALVGYDNSPQARELEVPLTSVDQRAEEMGRLAAEMIIGRMEGQKFPKKKRIILEPHLVMRESSQEITSAQQSAERVMSEVV